jgi:hypothetical protein
MDELLNRPKGLILLCRLSKPDAFADDKISAVAAVLRTIIQLLQYGDDGNMNMQFTNRAANFI